MAVEAKRRSLRLKTSVVNASSNNDDSVAAAAAAETQRKKGTKRKSSSQTSASDDFESDPLAPGIMKEVLWRSNPENKKQDIQNAFRLGVNPKITQALLEYCDKKGITAKFEQVLFKKGSALETGKPKDHEFEGEKWLIMHQGKPSNTNMHWVCPGNAKVHKACVNELLEADEVRNLLDQIGTARELQRLTIYSVFFLAVSKSGSGKLDIHTDTQDTDDKAFNILLPLKLVDGSEPELILQDRSPAGNQGKYKYRKDEAILLGDNANHSTNVNINYKEGSMRLMASIFIGEIGDHNIKGVAEGLPAVGVKWANVAAIKKMGVHWSRDESNRKRRPRK
jgi:hypothetical protein